MEGTQCPCCGEFFPVGNLGPKIWTSVCPKCGFQTVKQGGLWTRLFGRKAKAASMLSLNPSDQAGRARGKADPDSAGALEIRCPNCSALNYGHAENIVGASCSKCGQSLEGAILIVEVMRRRQLAIQRGVWAPPETDSADPCVGIDTDDLCSELHKIATREPFLGKPGGRYDKWGRHERARAIGRALNARGGITLMRVKWETICRLVGDNRRADELNSAWDGIGDWLA